MAKQPPRDNDATMDLSLSQLVVDPPPKPPGAPAPPKLPGVGPVVAPPKITNATGPKGGPNDVSLWAYRVVGTDDFAPQPETDKPAVRPFFVVLFVLGLLAGGAYVAYTIVH